MMIEGWSGVSADGNREKEDGRQWKAEEIL